MCCLKVVSQRGLQSPPSYCINPLTANPLAVETPLPYSPIELGLDLKLAKRPHSTLLIEHRDHNPRKRSSEYMLSIYQVYTECISRICLAANYPGGDTTKF